MMTLISLCLYLIASTKDSPKIVHYGLCLLTDATSPHTMTSNDNMITNNGLKMMSKEAVTKQKVKLSLYEAHRVVRRRGSHIF
jgi:hypothetical protein